MELCMCGNAVFFLPVNILMVWRAGFLSSFLSIYSWCGALDFLAARHTTMCLDHGVACQLSWAHFTAVYCNQRN